MTQRHLNQIADACITATPFCAFTAIWTNSAVAWCVCGLIAAIIAILIFADLRARFRKLFHELGGCDADGDSDYIHVGGE